MVEIYKYTYTYNLSDVELILYINGILYSQ